MTKQTISVTIVNHVSVDIACPPDAVWREILIEYVEAKKFGEIGYRIEPLDDPAAYLGGYRMSLEQDGVVVDDRIIQFSELDHQARRLSIFADYRSVPGGMAVYPTYHAAETPGGSRYHLDCHATLGIEQPVGAGQAEVAAAVAEMKTGFDTALITYLEGVKAKLETPN